MATDPRRILVERLFTLERLSNQLGDQAEKLIRELFDEIAAELARLDPGGVAVRYQQGRLDKLRARVRELTGETYEQVHREQRAALAAIGARQVKDATLELRAVIGAGSAGKLAPTTGLGANYFKAIIDTRPLQGALFEEWVKKQGTDTAFRVEQQVRLGMVGGETIDQMIRRVRGRRVPGGYTGGVLQTSTRQARTLVRTAVNDVSNTARMDTFGANADIIGAVTFVATLDEKTCFPAGTHVLTPAGEVPIEDVRPGSLVIGGSGATRRVTATMARDYSGIFGCMQVGGRVLVGTADHRVGTTAGWVEMRDLQPEHEVVAFQELIDSSRGSAFVDPHLFDVEDADAKLCKPSIPDGVALRVVPIRAVNLDCGVPVRKKEVDANSPKLALLFETETSCFEDRANSRLDARLSPVRSITPERAESARFQHRGNDAASLAAVETGDFMHRTSAQFRAEPAIFAPGVEPNAASLAVSVNRSAVEGAPAVSVSVRPGHGEIPAANLARLGNLSVVGGEVAGARAKLLVGLAEPATDEKRSVAARAHFLNSGDRGATNAGGIHAVNITDTAGCINFFEGSATVYDIEVEGDHCFFAEGVLVHNCVVCGGLDGKHWKVGDPEIRQPPLHFSDRCTLVPEIDWESLGMDPPPDGTRASRDGQVPSSTTYQDWLRGLSPEEQDEILGPERAALFRNGQVTLTQLVTSDGQRRTVDEISRDAIRFARGRGDPAIKTIGAGGVLPSPRQFSPAATKESAIAYAKEHFADEVDFGDLTLDQVNRINEGFDRVLRESLITGGNYRIGRIYLDPSLPEKEHMQWNPVGMGGDDRRGTIAISPDYVARATRTTLPANIDFLRKKGSHYVSEIADDELRSTAAHEAGHAVYHNDVMHLSFERGWGEAKLTKDDKAYVSRYAMKESHRNDHYEVFAEVTAAIADGNRKFMPPNVLRLYDSVINDAKIRLGYPK